MMSGASPALLQPKNEGRVVRLLARNSADVDGTVGKEYASGKRATRALEAYIFCVNDVLSRFWRQTHNQRGTAGEIIGSISGLSK